MGVTPGPYKVEQFNEWYTSLIGPKTNASGNFGHADAQFIAAACNAFLNAAHVLGVDPLELAKRFSDGSDLSDAIRPVLVDDAGRAAIRGQ